MKNTFTLMAILFCMKTSFAQLKKDIDVELLTEMVLKKQLEVRDEIINRSLKKSADFSNEASKNTMVNISNILMKEKNKLVIEQCLLAQLTRFSIAFVIAKITTDKKHMDSLTLKTNDRTKKQNIQNGEKVHETPKKKNSTSNDESIEFDKIMNYIYYDAFENTKYKNLFSKLKPESDRSTYFDYKIPIDTNNWKHKADTILSILNSTDKKITLINEAYKNFLRSIDSIELNKSKFSLEKTEKIITLVLALNEIINEQENSENLNLINIKLETFFNVLKIINRNIILYDHEGPNLDKRKFILDSESTILEFIDFFKLDLSYLMPISNHIIGIKPCFDIGVNYSSFSNKNSFKIDNDTISFKQMSWAGEKIGLKFVFVDHGYTRSQQTMDWYQYKKRYNRWLGEVNKPLVNNSYISIYGSGILYNLVDINTERKFNFGILGCGLGFEFFNGLNTSINYSLPFNEITNPSDIKWQNGFFSLSFDISLIDYLRALKDK